MSLIQRYPQFFSSDTYIIGNLANDYSAAPRHKQNFFDIARAGSSMPAQPDYYYPMRFAAPYTSQSRYLPFEAVQPTMGFAAPRSTAPQRLAYRLNTSPNPFTAAETIANIPGKIQANALAGRFVGSLFN
jgi:hypothetical protein